MWNSRLGWITGKGLVTIGCLGLSAVALAGVTRLESARPATGGVVSEPEAPARSAPIARPSIVTRKPGAAVALASTTPMAAVERRPSLLVPDFKGKRLSVARREGKKLGLVLTARDESGERVPADMSQYYRVRRQLTVAGEAVDPGASVELRVRAVGEAAGGY